MARPAPHTVALVLAAGASVRFGESKQLVDWAGVPLLQHVVAEAARWPVRGVVVVLGAHADEILEVIDFGEAMVVINFEWEEGIASSLRVGLDALTQDPAVEAALIALGDQPGIDPAVVERIVAAAADANGAVVPRYRYTRGNPVLVRRWLWDRLMSLGGDTGARQLLQAHPEWVEEIQVDRLPPRDVDTKADADELRPRR